MNTPTLAAPEGMEDEVSSLPCFRNGIMTVSCWQLTQSELNEVVASGGKVFLAVMFGATQPPVFLADEHSVREVVSRYGETWIKAN